MGVPFFGTPVVFEFPASPTPFHLTQDGTGAGTGKCSVWGALRGFLC